MSEGIAATESAGDQEMVVARRIVLRERVCCGEGGRGIGLDIRDGRCRRYEVMRFRD